MNHIQKIPPCAFQGYPMWVKIHPDGIEPRDFFHDHQCKHFLRWYDNEDLVF